MEAISSLEEMVSIFFADAGKKTVQAISRCTGKKYVYEICNKK